MDILECGDGGKALGSSPWFDAGAAPVGSDQADGHVEFAHEVAGKIVSDSRKRPGGVGRSDLPAIAGHIVLRMLGWLAGNFDVANARVLGVGYFLFGISGFFYCPFHVRLTRAEPDFADEDVFVGDGIFAADFEIGSR